MKQSPTTNWKFWFCILTLMSITVAGAYVGNGSVKLEKMSHSVKIQKIPTGALAGQKVNRMYQLMLGTESPVIPDTIAVDFTRQLRRMFANKLENAGANRQARVTQVKLEKEYASEPIHQHSIRSYTDVISGAAVRVFYQMRWDDFCADRGLTPERCELEKDIGKWIRGPELLSYGLTELMPSDNGGFNVRIAELILQHAGSGYLERVPSQHDPLVSFGQWQTTKFAVLDKGGDVRGASTLAQFLADPSELPRDVSKLRNEDHHEAAYLFAMHNVSRIILSLSPSEFRYFADNWREHRTGLVEMIALSHHSPKNARTAAKRWIQSNMRGDLGDYTTGKRKTKLAQYAQKTRANYRAIVDAN